MIRRIVALIALAPAAAAARQQADLILVNGHVITVDAADRIAQAIAIRGNRILAVGTTAEVERAAPNARRIDLKGATVTPGLLDAHNHFAGAGVDRLLLLDVSYPAVKSVGDVVAAVSARVRQSPRGKWVEGRGWDEGKLAEKRLLTARDLDVVSPDNPVWLEHTTGHYGVANSAALKLAGITRDTKAPPGATIDHDAAGNPTGVLKEGAQDMVRRLIPPASPDEIERGMRDLARAFNAEGMTGLKDPGISTETFRLYRKAAAAGELPVRVFALWSGGRSTGAARRLIAEHAADTRPYAGTGDDHVIAGGVKLFLDGSGGARTAWMHEDWNRDYTGVDSGNRGYPTTNPDTIRALIRMYHDAGMHVGVHAIGDRAIDWVVDTYDQAMRENPKVGLRHSIIHANIPTDRALDVMARLQKQFDAGYPEPSATFTWWIGDTYAGNFGPARSRRLNPFRSFLDRGMVWANGSDFDVTPFPARYGIWAAIAREPLLGVYASTEQDPFGRTQSVDARAALRSVTIWAARQMFLEQKIGSIEPGKYADLAVWDRDFYTAPTAAIKDAKCLMTLFDGRIVYRADGTPF
jgi:hypothetical protein